MNSEEISFYIISYSSAAKQKIIAALNLAENNQINQADQLIEQAHQEFISAHQYHAKLVSEAASGEKQEYSLLLVHAEDQLMNVELLLDLASRLIKLNAKVN